MLRGCKDRTEEKKENEAEGKLMSLKDLKLVGFLWVLSVWIYGCYEVSSSHQISCRGGNDVNSETTWSVAEESEDNFDFKSIFEGMITMSLMVSFAYKVIHWEQKRKRDFSPHFLPIMSQILMPQPSLPSSPNHVLARFSFSHFFMSTQNSQNNFNFHTARRIVSLQILLPFVISHRFISQQ